MKGKGEKERYIHLNAGFQRRARRDKKAFLGGSGWGTHGHLWRIHVNVWQNQYNIVKEKKKERKKAFHIEQCKEIEENKRMGKTRDLFKKIRDTKGTFHAKMATIKDRNGTDLTEADSIKKRWQEYIGKLYQKEIFMIQITTMV